MRSSWLLLAIFVICCTQQAVLGGACNSYSAEKLNEGYYKCVYKDPLGIPTIGVGFNLKKFNARAEIESVGADYDKVLSGAECLSDSQIESLFNKDMSSAVSCVSSWLPNWSSIGSSPQSALADMAFNMGCAGVEGFVGMKAALTENPPDYSSAASHMRSSLWCRQVGNRCDRDINCMEAGTHVSGL